MNQESPSQDLVPLKKRRTRIPDKPNYSLNLWSIMKNCIGKELSKIPMPVGAFGSRHHTRWLNCFSGRLQPTRLQQGVTADSGSVAESGLFCSQRKASCDVIMSFSLYHHSFSTPQLLSDCTTLSAATLNMLTSKC